MNSQMPFSMNFFRLYFRNCLKIANIAASVGNLENVSSMMSRMHMGVRTASPRLMAEIMGNFYTTYKDDISWSTRKKLVKSHFTFYFNFSRTMRFFIILFFVGFQAACDGAPGPKYPVPHLPANFALDEEQIEKRARKYY